VKSMPSSYKIKFPRATNDIVINDFSDTEKELLDKVVTNTDKRVFGWKVSSDLTPEEVGALLSRYSRTVKTGRELYLQEFYPNRSRGREFFKNWLVEFGDDSIQEMAGGIPISCEFISNLAVKEIEDGRIGASYIEKSTRYVPFDKKLSDGSFMYYKDEGIMSSRHGDAYIELMDGLFTSYSNYVTPMTGLLKEKNPIEKIKFKVGDESITIGELNSSNSHGLSEEDMKKAYENAIRANAFDLLRDYLPMSTLTHVGISANPRAYENMIIKMSASKLGESRELATEMHTELTKLVPSLTERVYGPHGNELREFIRIRKDNVAESVNSILHGVAPEQTQQVTLYDYTGKDSNNPNNYATTKIVAQIMHKPAEGHSKSQLLEIASKMTEDERKGIIAKYLSERKNRRHKPGRAFELVNYDFDLKGRIGIYRDLQRHRICTQERQDFGVSLGYNMRKEFEDIGIADDYRDKMKQVVELHTAIKETMPEQAQYAVTFGFEVRWDYSINARELYYVGELRTTPQGHPDYRKVVQDMVKSVEAVHPTVCEGMSFVNMEETTVGRLGSEIRMATKRKELEAKK